MVRPLLREPGRTSLTILAIALGVAVVLAIDLAGGAAAGSFRSSMETLAGDNDLEVRASEACGKCGRNAGHAALCDSRLAAHRRLRGGRGHEEVASRHRTGSCRRGQRLRTERISNRCRTPDAKTHRRIRSSIWETRMPFGWARALATRRATASRCSSTIKSATTPCKASTPIQNGNESAIVMDLAAAQNALARYGRVDRVLLKVPRTPSLEEWQQRLGSVLPPGVEVRPQGSGTNENRRMLAAFRWEFAPPELHFSGGWRFPYLQHHFRFRRSPPPGHRNCARPRRQPWRYSLSAFVGEAASFGLAGALLAFPRTFHGHRRGSLDVRHRGIALRQQPPGTIELNAASVLLALVIGVGVAVASAYSPAREASKSRPSRPCTGPPRIRCPRAQARGLWLALVLGSTAAAASRAPAIAGKPILGYLAAILLVVASALAMPASLPV